jgi:hypothetical protein
MEFLNKVQQVRAHAGSHKGAAIIAGRFCQSGVLAIKATSKHLKIARSFGSTGIVHGIPPNLRNDCTQEHRRTGFKSFFGYFRQNLQDCSGPTAGRKLSNGTGKSHHR